MERWRGRKRGRGEEGVAGAALALSAPWSNPNPWADRPTGRTDGGREGPAVTAAVAAAGARRMVQKESQAALEERESELTPNPATAAATAGGTLEAAAAPSPGEGSQAGAGGGTAASAAASGGARRFLCGVVEGEGPSRNWVQGGNL